MKACENIECHDTVVRMSYFIKGLCVIATLLIGTISTAIYYGMGADKADKARISYLENKIAVIEKDTNKIDDILKNQQSNMLNLQKLEDDITHETERSKRVDEVIFRKLGERDR